jgi:Fe-S-cluster-containing dehydrogenase component
MPNFQRGFKIDLTRCIGCRACVAACIMENNLDPYVHWRDVLDFELGTYPNADRIHVTMACFHCAEPACMPACPVNAITKDPIDGVVIINEATCIGCRRCIAACPYGAPRFNPATNKVEKCTFCKHRVGDTRSPENLPACVATCPAKALEYVELSPASYALPAAPTGFSDPALTKPSAVFVLGSRSTAASVSPAFPV